MRFYFLTIFSIMNTFFYLCPAKTGITTRQGRMSYASRSSRFASGACEIRQSSTKAVSPSTLFITRLKITHLSNTLKAIMQEFCGNLPPLPPFKGARGIRGWLQAGGVSQRHRHLFLKESHPTSRMMVRQYLTLSTRIDMKIYLGYRNRAVAQNMLDIGNVDVFFKKKSGKRVSESMRCNMLFYLALVC